jgi:hypothetical protein
MSCHFEGFLVPCKLWTYVSVRGQTVLLPCTEGPRAFAGLLDTTAAFLQTAMASLP